MADRVGVPPNPLVTIEVDEFGRLTINGHDVSYDGTGDPRQVANEVVCMDFAQPLGRPVRALATLPHEQVRLVIHPDGRVTDVEPQPAGHARRGAAGDPRPGMARGPGRSRRGRGRRRAACRPGPPLPRGPRRGRGARRRRRAGGRVDPARSRHRRAGCWPTRDARRGRLGTRPVGHRVHPDPSGRRVRSECGGRTRGPPAHRRCTAPDNGACGRDSARGRHPTAAHAVDPGRERPPGHPARPGSGSVPLGGAGAGPATSDRRHPRPRRPRRSRTSPRTWSRTSSRTSRSPTRTRHRSSPAPAPATAPIPGALGAVGRWGQRRSAAAHRHRRRSQPSRRPRWQLGVPGAGACSPRVSRAPSCWQGPQLASSASRPPPIDRGPRRTGRGRVSISTRTTGPAAPGSGAGRSVVRPGR